MPTFVDALRVTIGAATKKTDADNIAANTEFNRESADVDHDFDISTGNGYHKQVRMDTSQSFAAPSGEAKSYYNSSDGFVITSDGTRTFSVMTSAGGTSRIAVLNSNGYVGIVNESPQAILHVGAGTDAPTQSNVVAHFSAAGTTAVSYRDSTNNDEGFVEAGNGYFRIGNSTANTQFRITYEASDGSEMRVMTIDDSNGGSPFLYVGMGTITTPTRPFDFGSDSNGTLRITADTDDSASTSTSSVVFAINSAQTEKGTVGYSEAADHAFLAYGTINTDGVTIDSNINIGFGTGTFGTNAAGVLGIADGTAPSSSPSNMVQLYSEGGELKVRDSGGNITTLSPHAMTLYRPDPDERMPYMFSHKNFEVGLLQEIDMTGLIRAVERLTGQQFIHTAELN